MNSSASDSVTNQGPKRLGLTQLASLVCIVLLLAAALDQLRREGSFRVDDAYITFSFSKNLAAGNGPIFSHGLRVEGYSNFLWMLVVAVRYLFHAEGDPYSFARVVAFGCLALAAFTVYRLTRRAASLSYGATLAGEAGP